MTGFIRIWFKTIGYNSSVIKLIKGLTMQRSGNIFRMCVVFFLLFLFIFKLSCVILSFVKVQKPNYSFIDSSGEEKDNTEKKDDSKTAVKINDELDRLPTDFLHPFIFTSISSLHPRYLLNFIVSHYLTVLTPPPNYPVV